MLRIDSDDIRSRWCCIGLPDGEPPGFLIDHQVGRAHEESTKYGQVIIVVGLETVDDDVADGRIGLDGAVRGDVRVRNHELGVGYFDGDAALQLNFQTAIVTVQSPLALQPLNRVVKALTHP